MSAKNTIGNFNYQELVVEVIYVFVILSSYLNSYFWCGHRSL